MGVRKFILLNSFLLNICLDIHLVYNNDILWQGTVTQIIAQKINPEKFKNCALFILSL